MEPLLLRNRGFFMLNLATMHYLIALFLCLVCSTSSMSETINVAVASNFRATAIQLKHMFEKELPDSQINIISGSSTKLFTHIQQGAPFHLFLSADTQLPQQLVSNKKTLQGPYRYAQGRLALYSTKSGIDAQQCLKQLCFDHIALANAKFAPYGMASEQTLSSLGLYERSQAKFIQSENIHQVLQFIRTKNVDLGFVALSQLRALSIEENFWLIPQQLYQPIYQDAVLLLPAKNKPTAKRFWQFLKSQTAQHIMQQYGYLNP